MAWCERTQMPLAPGVTCDSATALAIKAWNWMGGQIDWTGLPLIAEILGVDDLEVLIVQLAALRDWQRKT